MKKGDFKAREPTNCKGWGEKGEKGRVFIYLLKPFKKILS